MELEYKLVSSGLGLQVLPSHVTNEIACLLFPLCNRGSMLLMCKQKLSPYIVVNDVKLITPCEDAFLCYTEIFILLSKNSL